MTGGGPTRRAEARFADTMNETTFLRQIDGIKVWRRGGQRAPHKPLLLLLALSRLQRGEVGPVHYERDVRGPLRDLLRRFGPQRRSHHPENPFWYLRSDGLWEIPDEDLDRIRGGRSDSPKRQPTDRALRDADARGRFPTPVEQLLERSPELIEEAAQRLLGGHFAPSMHDEIRAAVAWTAPADRAEASASKTSRRDPRFRVAVLRAYARRCVVCNYDLRLDDDLVGLDAAHIRWHSHGGPDEVRNGLALCTLHHRTFDRGAFGLTKAGDGYRIVVSDVVHGQSPAFRQLLDCHGRPLRSPQRELQRPSPDFVAWHSRQVFRGDPREAEGR